MKRKKLIRSTCKCVRVISNISILAQLAKMMMMMNMGACTQILCHLIINYNLLSTKILFKRKEKVSMSAKQARVCVCMYEPRFIENKRLSEKVFSHFFRHTIWFIHKCMCLFVFHICMHIYSMYVRCVECVCDIRVSNSRFLQWLPIKNWWCFWASINC